MKKVKKRGVLMEFKEFLKEYKIITLAVAFVMGAATNDLVKSFVNNLIMPLIDPLIPDGTWETAILKLGPISLGWGSFVSSAIHFIILAAVVFFVVKKLLLRKKKEDVPQVQY